MMYDVQYGNVSPAEARRLGRSTPGIDGVPHEPGCTEPHISRLVWSLVLARGARTVLETGCFKGATSVYLYEALARLGGGHLHLCEIDPVRMDSTAERVRDLTSVDTEVRVHCHTGDVLSYLARTEDRFDVAWVDDAHEKPHVQREMELLYPKMNPGGLVLLHDVHGVCDLQSVVKQWGGIALDFARFGPAGGIGILQVTD